MRSKLTTHTPLASEWLPRARQTAPGVMKVEDDRPRLGGRSRPRAGGPSGVRLAAFLRSPLTALASTGWGL